MFVLDINECQLNIHTCHESQRCDNSIGSYQCVRFTGCGTGYTLDVETSTCLGKLFTIDLIMITIVKKKNLVNNVGIL